MTSEEWGKVSIRVRAVFNFGIEKSEWLEKSRLARFIAATPFLAGCEKADETSFTHLAIFIMSNDESAKEIYFHKKDDDIDLYSRLVPMSNFKGGNQDVIKCCMDLIALNMISNYKNDAEADKAIGKYNPLNEAGWDFKDISERLIENINKSITPEISGFYTVEDALNGVWKS